MTDSLFDLTNSGPVAKNPITNAGRVAGNARIAQAHIEERKDATAKNSLYPSSDMSDEVFSMKQREIALMVKTHAQVGSDGLMPVFSVLNGLGHDGSSRKQLLEELTFAGLVGSDGVVFSSKGDHPANADVALILGGTTTIMNTGPYHIANGDYIMWDLPEVGSSPDPHNKRILVSTVPYRPSEQGVTVSRIVEHMRTQGARNDTPIAGASRSLRNFTRVFSIMALKAFLDSGLVAFDADAMGVTESAVQKRRMNAQSWGAIGSKNQEEHLVRVARALRAANIQDVSQTAGVNMVLGHPGMSLAGYLDSLMIDMTPLIGHMEGSNLAPSGDSGMLYRGQKGLLHGLLAGMHQAQESMRSRVFARASIPAAPGRAMDINIGSYSV